MRKLTPAYVVTSIVIAAAGSAFAQTGGRVAGGTNTARIATTAPAAQGNVNQSNANANGTASGTNTTGTTSTTNANGTSSNSTGMDGSRSGNNTNSSAANTPIGSTSANGNSTNVNGNTSTNTSSNNNTSRSGSNTASSAANSPIGSTSATGSSSVNGTTTTNDTGTTANTTGNAAAVIVPGVGGYANPGVVNGITSDGERVNDNSGNTSDAGANTNGNAQLQNNGNAGAFTSDAALNSQNFDRALKQVQKDRRKIGRNGQLLQTIAPRTNADRGYEMPDDAPSPALTGSSSALTRR
jgi:hypothetical protein